MDESALRKALRKKPHNGDLHFALGELKFNQGRPREAVAALLNAQRSLEKDEKLAFDVRYLLGLCWLDLEEYDRADSVLQRAVTQAPEGCKRAQLAMCHRLLSSLALNVRENPFSALKQARRAAEIYPEDEKNGAAVEALEMSSLGDEALALGEAAHRYLYNHQWSEALNLIDQLLAKAPSSLPLLRMRATALRGLKRYQEQMDVLERLIEVDRSPALLYERCYCHLSLGNKVVAKKDLEEALQLGLEIEEMDLSMLEISLRSGS